MDLNHICRIIFDAACDVEKKLDGPIAFINVRVGKNFQYSDEEFLKCFGTIKWDSPISTSDLVLVHDDSMTDALAKIEEISGFMDESGNSKKYSVPLEKAIIKR